MLATASVPAAMFVATLLAQAEPAPPEPPAPKAPVVAPEPMSPDPAPPNAMAIHARFAYRLGAEGASPGPSVGFSLGASFRRRYLPLSPRLSLGVAVDLLHDHFAKDVQSGSQVVPAEQPPDAQQVVSQTSFAALQTVAAELDRVGLWLAAGGGLTVASLWMPEPMGLPRSLRTVQPIGRLAAGIDVAVGARTAIGVRADLTHPFTHPTLATPNAGTLSPFGDLFDAGLAFVYRF